MSGQTDGDASKGVGKTAWDRINESRQGGAAPVTTPRFLTVCAWCERVRLGRRWLRMDELVRRLHMFESVEPPQLTHGICPSCLEPLIARRTVRDTVEEQDRAA